MYQINAEAVPIGTVTNAQHFFDLTKGNIFIIIIIIPSSYNTFENIVELRYNCFLFLDLILKDQMVKPLGYTSRSRHSRCGMDKDIGIVI